MAVHPSPAISGASRRRPRTAAASGLLGGAGIAAWAVRRLPDRGVWRLNAPSLDVPIPRRVMVVASANAGGAGGLDEALDVMRKRGFEVVAVFPVEEADRLRQRLRADGAAWLVVAAGGDGTVSAAANAIAGSDAVLAILPLGTSNDIARSLGIPTDPVKAAVAVARGRVCGVDSGRATAHDRAARVFLNAASVGLNVAFARGATLPALRKRFGRFTYVVAMARALREQRPFECTLEHDGARRTLQVVQIAVSNAPAFGGALGLRVPGATMTDGLLDVVVVEPLSRPGRARAVGRAALGRPEPLRGLHVARVRALDISAADRQQITLDGELSGELPLSVEARRDGIRVVVPQP